MECLASLSTVQMTLDCSYGSGVSKRYGALHGSPDSLSHVELLSKIPALVRSMMIMGEGVICIYINIYFFFYLVYYYTLYV